MTTTIRDPDCGTGIGEPHRIQSDLDELLKSDDILVLRDICMAFFGSASEGKTYARRPSLALRLPHDDFVMVVKPTTRHEGGIVTVDQRGIVIECLRRFDDRKSAKWLTVLVTSDVRKLCWMRNETLSIEAATALVEMAGFFAIDPFFVMEKNKDNCCCCGKGLTDEVSRARGIGPECLGRLNMFFSSLSISTTNSHGDKCDQ
ncbi:MAG: DUF6011 domain-containing protein [Planctomycetota bacterium]